MALHGQQPGNLGCTWQDKHAPNTCGAAGRVGRQHKLGGGGAIPPAAARRERRAPGAAPMPPAAALQPQARDCALGRPDAANSAPWAARFSTKTCAPVTQLSSAAAGMIQFVWDVSVDWNRVCDGRGAGRVVCQWRLPSCEPCSRSRISRRLPCIGCVGCDGHVAVGRAALPACSLQPHGRVSLPPPPPFCGHRGGGPAYPHNKPSMMVGQGSSIRSQK